MTSFVLLLRKKKKKEEEERKKERKKEKDYFIFKFSVTEVCISTLIRISSFI